MRPMPCMAEGGCDAMFATCPAALWPLVAVLLAGPRAGAAVECTGCGAMVVAMFAMSGADVVVAGAPLWAAAVWCGCDSSGEPLPLPKTMSKGE